LIGTYGVKRRGGEAKATRRYERATGVKTKNKTYWRTIAAMSIIANAGRADFQIHLPAL